ncbi:radical SAM protein [Polyangium jinanense]|uniref:Radical SAM protein n=1 Tax=Polyangium jinanense TaxID=2829994 RepID=A0A9X3X2C8_9BACT|nr:radical SAM protein [Polyangium jinanense]MDC3955219.1 radical SAM protein [Polyangium jinanense]MDC3981520.1 radical SAM protein [Polyangium jinanense]
MSFHTTLERYDFDDVSRRLSSTDGFTDADVERALDVAPGDRGPEDFLALLSAPALRRLPDLETRARTLTREVFGPGIEMFAPLYLSNTCKTTCTYCGFAYKNDITRKTLTTDEAEEEGRILHQRGFRRLLLLTGEDYVATPVAYLADACRALAGMFPSLKLEVYPLSESDYEGLRAAGATGIVCYQETYDRRRYREVHLRGMKRKYDYRLNCLDRAARAGLLELSTGALLGLSDPRTDTFFAGMHAHSLLQTHPGARLSISLPRLRPAAGFEDVPLLPDPVYVQMFLATRLFLPRAGLILSTREPHAMRMHLASLCITTMSAGVSVAPGGYSGADTTPQFSLGDHSTTAEVAESLGTHGLHASF